MSNVWKGALRYKKKQDLLDILSDLGIDGDAHSNRPELEVAARSALDARRAELEDTPQFKGLFDSIDSNEKRHGRRSTAADSDGSENGTPEDNKSPRKHTQRAKTNGVASSVSTPSINGFTDLVKRQVVRGRRSLEGLRDSFNSSAHNAAEEVDDLAGEVNGARLALTRRLRNQVRAGTRYIERQSASAREVASSASNINAVVVAVEAAVLLLGATPTTYLAGGDKHLSAKQILKTHGRSATAGHIPHWAITVPDVRGFLSVSFWQPIVLWAFFTVAVPFVLSHLITFDRRRHASPFTFALARLFAILYLTFLGGNSIFHSVPATLGVAAGEPASRILPTRSLFSYASVSDLISPQFQVLGAGVAVSFALYETIAARPRSS